MSPSRPSTPRWIRSIFDPIKNVFMFLFVLGLLQSPVKAALIFGSPWLLAFGLSKALRPLSETTLRRIRSRLVPAVLVCAALGLGGMVFVIVRLPFWEIFYLGWLGLYVCWFVDIWTTMQLELRRSQPVPK